MNFESLAFTPLDLPRIDVDYENLKNMMDVHGKEHQPYPQLWHAYAVCGRIDDFDDPWQCDDAWNKRYDTDPNIRWNPNTPPIILEQFKQLLSALPYKICTFSQILSQKMNVPPHQDGLYDVNAPVRKAVYDGAIDFNGEPEPAGLKIMLSHRNHKSFYLTERPGARKQFIELPEDTCSFAINERKFWHGAKHPGAPKYVLSTFGIIDPDKHKQLIEQSLLKYEDYAIRF